MMPPMNMPISQLIEETGISDCTLYTWRKIARVKGVVVPGNGRNAQGWSSEDKFSVVVETLSLNEAELAQYCRKKGLYVDEIKRWKESCQQANAKAGVLTKKERAEIRQDKQQVYQLKKELRRKEKALKKIHSKFVVFYFMNVLILQIHK